MTTARGKTVIVLGAGASCHYNYPTGRGLRDKVIELLKNVGPSANVLGVPPSDLQAFVSAFKTSQAYSIDAFLARRLEFAEVGKAAIALILLACENRDVLFHESSADERSIEKKSDHWYQYLLNSLLVDDWEDLRLDWLSVVTFNYDRSLEQFLQLAIESNSGESKEAVRERLRQLQIIHVYGDLGSIWPDEGGFPYADGSMYRIEERVRIAKNRLRVVAEGRDDDAHLTRCKTLIAEADRICLLGFGFDATNLRRIGAPEGLLRSDGYAKDIVATSLGLTTNEVRIAVRRLVGEGAFRHGDAMRNFRPVGCLELLRQSQILNSEFGPGIIDFAAGG